MLPESVLTRLNVTSALDDKIVDWFKAVGAASIGLGILNVLFVHGSKFLFVKRGWQFSLTLIVGMLLGLIVMSFDWWRLSQVSEHGKNFDILAKFGEKISKEKRDPEKDFYPYVLKEVSNTKDWLIGQGPSWERDELTKTLGEIEKKPSTEKVAPILTAAAGLSRAVGRHAYEGSKERAAYKIMMDGVFTPLATSLFSLLAFFMATAAYRAFRIRSFEAVLMLIAAAIVMIGQTPFGPQIWEGFPSLRLWLLQIPNAGAFRAIKIGAAVAGLVLLFRMWLSIEANTGAREEKS